MKYMIPLALLLLSIFSIAHAQPVSCNQTAAAITLSNGLVSAAINKSAGTFTLTYRQTKVIDHGYWTVLYSGGPGERGFGSQPRVTVNTTDQRGEVVLSFPYDGKGFACDVEVHYALLAGQSSLYAWTTWTHRKGYPATDVTLSRAAAKLPGDLFDYIAIDQHRHGLMPTGADWDHGETLNMKEARRMTTGAFKGKAEHKYDYAMCFADTPAYGWISTKKNIGVFMINPSIEYIAGGPTKTELSAHLDGNPGGAPTLLNVFIGPHYGGTILHLDQDEQWTKAFGPFLFHCVSDASPEAIFRQANADGMKEQRAWPYRWMHQECPPEPYSWQRHPEPYSAKDLHGEVASIPDGDPSRSTAQDDHLRGGVSGRLMVQDQYPSALSVHNLHVGLAAAPYTVGDQTIDWQRDAKHYQYWTRGDDDGSFVIPSVRPGTYMLYAYADGILGSFSRGDVTVAAGQSLDLGELTWKPGHFGKPIWEIGIPNRSASEFRHGDDYWHWGLYNLYPQEFPSDVDFVIGQSDFRKDWNYCQPPRVEDGKIKSTTWTISFNLPEAPAGKATLRLSICGYRGPAGISVAVNGHPTSGTGPIPEDGVMHRDGIHGVLYERDVSFDAGLLENGENRITLTPRAKAWPDGVLYDYLRLEIDERSKSNR